MCIYAYMRVIRKDLRQHIALMLALSTGGLAFMFETCHTLRLSSWALNAEHLDTDYHKCWDNMPILFDGKP